MQSHTPAQNRTWSQQFLHYYVCANVVHVFPKLCYFNIEPLHKLDVFANLASCSLGDLSLTIPFPQIVLTPHENGKRLNWKSYSNTFQAFLGYNDLLVTVIELVELW